VLEGAYVAFGTDGSSRLKRDTTINLSVFVELINEESLTQLVGTQFGGERVLPLSSICEHFVTVFRETVVIRPPIDVSFLYKTLFDDCIEVRVEPTVVDIVKLFLQLFFHVLPRGVIEASNNDEEVTLKACELKDLVCHIGSSAYLFLVVDPFENANSRSRG
jgi:hypothetical protein